jgi:hypothetical protein
VVCRRSKYLDPFSFMGIFRRAGMHFSSADWPGMRIDLSMKLLPASNPKETLLESLGV